jgi:hypothetical protein
MNRHDLAAGTWALTWHNGRSVAKTETRPPRQAKRGQGGLESPQVSGGGGGVQPQDIEDRVSQDIEDSQLTSPEEWSRVVDGVS